jgi:peptide chain release factor 1
MNYEEHTLASFRENPKTQFLAGQFDELTRLHDEAVVLGESDPDMAAMAAEEVAALEAQRGALYEEMNRIVALAKTEEEKPYGVMLEVRAGAGGDEAALFAEELARMYLAYAESKGWSYTVENESRGPAGGYKEASFEIVSGRVYDDLRYETGVHRVQRIPVTEKAGRIHTSTASVAILPMRKKPTIEINPSDILMEFSTPTGIEVRSQTERSQLKNREKAMTLLVAKLEAIHDEEEAKQHASERKDQIGTGDRSEKIRTYNFPQNRITDHRIKVSWHNIEGVMAGNLGAVIEALHAYARGEETPVASP